MNSGDKRKEEAKKIIHDFAVASAAASAALSQAAITGADTTTLYSLHLEMADRLAKLFDKTLDDEEKNQLKNIVIPSSGVYAAKAIIGWLPALGNAANAAISYKHTEKVGDKIYEYFENKT